MTTKFNAPSSAEPTVPAMSDFFEYSSQTEYDGGAVKIVINAETTQNFKTVIEQSMEDDFRIMTEKELNRRLSKCQGHYRVKALGWDYSNKETPTESEYLHIEVSTRPVGVEDL